MCYFTGCHLGLLHIGTEIVYPPLLAFCLDFGKNRHPDNMKGNITSNLIQNIYTHLSYVESTYLDDVK